MDCTVCCPHPFGQLSSTPSSPSLLQKRILGVCSSFDMCRPHLPLQPSCCLCRFGTSVALSAYTLVVGAPGDSLLAPNTGAITLIDTEYKRVQFAQKEYRVSEGVAMRRVVILVSVRIACAALIASSSFTMEHRFSVQVNRYGDLSGSLTVQYSTRDITAIGVNATYHQTCLKSIPFGSRSAAGCGDYEQTRGLVRDFVLLSHVLD